MTISIRQFHPVFVGEVSGADVTRGAHKAAASLNPRANVRRAASSGPLFP
jgi:hypothetical protein